MQPVSAFSPAMVSYQPTYTRAGLPYSQIGQTAASSSGGPLEKGLKTGAKSAFNPQGLAWDGVFGLLMVGMSKLLWRQMPAQWNLMLWSFGIGTAWRFIRDGFQGYQFAKNGGPKISITM